MVLVIELIQLWNANRSFLVGRRVWPAPTRVGAGTSEVYNRVVPADAACANRGNFGWC